VTSQAQVCVCIMHAECAVWLLVEFHSLRERAQSVARSWPSAREKRAWTRDQASQDLEESIFEPLLLIAALACSQKAYIKTFRVAPRTGCGPTLYITYDERDSFIGTRDSLSIANLFAHFRTTSRCGRRRSPKDVLCFAQRRQTQV
jgi:hypothetical protein